MPETTPFSHVAEPLEIAARAALEKNASNVLALDVSARLPITDAFLIVSADTERQVQAVVENVEDKLAEAGMRRKRREGFSEGRWVLCDFGDLIVHVLHRDEREEYALERLWADCPARNFSEEEQLA